MRSVLFIVPAMVLAGAAVAESGRGNPTDPKASVPPIEYRSAFERYRAFADQEPRDWRKANEEVARLASRPQAGKSQSGHAGDGGHK